MFYAQRQWQFFELIRGTDGNPAVQTVRDRGVRKIAKAMLFPRGKDAQGELISEAAAVNRAKVDAIVERNGDEHEDSGKKRRGKRRKRQ